MQAGLLAATVAALVLAAADARAQQTPAEQRGLTFVRTHCARCHAIDKVSPSPLGVAPPSKSVTVMRDTRNNRGHAVLTVVTGDTRLVLDNLVDQVKPDSAVPWYRPVYAVSVDGNFMFGTMPAPQLAMIRPGETDARPTPRGSSPR